jgi:hypothetical protein
MKREPAVFPGRAAIALSLLLFVEALSGAELQRPAPPSPALPPAWKTEIKLYVTAENAAQAIKALDLDEHRAVKELVCFFDTRDGALEANHLILRARQSVGQPGESTVKLRAPARAVDLSEAERAIPAEQDWTNETEPTLSRSVDREGLARGLVAKVASGRAAVEELFDDAQRKLVEARMKEFTWGSLRAYGPVEARVWHQQWKLRGFPEAVTVELWHLRRDGRSQDILEVSAKARAETAAQAQVLARQFFSAAKAAGLGEPAHQTKTRRTLDFFKPGYSKPP